MVIVAFQTIRTRWKLFLGTFVALTFGIAVMASMLNIVLSVEQNRPLQDASTRYDAASAIITADQQLRVRQGDGSEKVITLPEWRQIPARTVEAIAEMPGVQQVITDRTFPAIIANKPEASQPNNRQTGHGWSSAQLMPFQLVAGDPPQPGEVVITKAIARAAQIAVGSEVSVSTPTGVQQFMVSGITRTSHDDSLPGEDTIFFADSQAAQLSGTPNLIDAIGIIASPGQNLAELRDRLIGALPDKSLLVKTGADKGGNVAADIYTKSIASVTELVGFNIGIAGFVCIFVVAGTAAFAIAQRRQEMALLRLIGATPKQVRRMILGETIFVALMAAIAGSFLGALCSGALASLLKNYQLAPTEFTAGGTWAGALIASGIGIVVALTGVFFASRRASKVRAAEAMRDAAAEQQVMTRGRWITGVSFLIISIAMIVLMLLVGGPVAMALAVLVTEMLAVALALLMPVFVKPLVWLMTIRLVKATNIVGMLVRANLQAAARRTTSTAAPILVAVSITISMVGVNVMIANADQRNLQDRTLASHIITGNMPLSVVKEARQIPGVASAVAAPSSTLYPEDLAFPIEFGTLDPTTLKGAFNVDVDSGSIDRLGKNDVVVNILAAQDLGWKIGQTRPVFLSDGTKVSLKIAAIINMPAALPEVLLSPELTNGHINSPMVENVFIRITENAGPETISALESLASTTGAQIQTKEAWIADKAVTATRESKLAMVIMLGLALAYLSIAIANTLLMAVSSRTKDIELLRKLGVSNRQILGMIAWETVVVTAIGSLLASFIASLTILGVYGAISQVIPGTPIPFMQPAYILVIGISLLVALLASVVPVALQLKKSSRITINQ